MLKIENLHASVAGKEILKGLSLDVKPGQVHAIMGPNGAGKSTLGNVLAGREGYEVTAGSVEFDGKALFFPCLDNLPDEERPIADVWQRHVEQELARLRARVDQLEAAQRMREPFGPFLGNSQLYGDPG